MADMNWTGRRGHAARQAGTGTRIATMAELSESVAGLRIVGDDLDPEEVTRLLGKAPDLARRKGEVALAAGRERVARTGTWMLNTDSSAPGDLDRQIDELLAGTTDDLAVWRRLADRYRIDVFCGLFMKELNEGIAISPQTLQKLAERGIRLDLDIYAASKEGED
jgi:hypothetical protein